MGAGWGPTARGAAIVWLTAGGSRWVKARGLHHVVLLLCGWRQQMGAGLGPTARGAATVCTL